MKITGNSTDILRVISGGRTVPQQFKELSQNPEKPLHGEMDGKIDNGDKCLYDSIGITEVLYFWNKSEIARWSIRRSLDNFKGYNQESFPDFVENKQQQSSCFTGIPDFDEYIEFLLENPRARKFEIERFHTFGRPKMAKK